MLSSTRHSSAATSSILDVSYAFDAIKNELTSRITSGDISISEGFIYDNNNRLTEWTNPVTDAMHKNVYDQQGRITENNQVGKINFGSSGSIYRPSTIDLNTEGKNYYTNENIQKIGFNENNDPTFIDGVIGDAAFSYGLSNMRQVVSYGGNFDVNSQGKFTKFYSEDASFEITVDNTTGKEKHILYIGGSPYNSNILYLKDFNQSQASYHYLHKDYLGSILAITDSNGKKLEQRHYDAWGNLTHLKIGTAAVITDQNLIKNTQLLLDRGYTSHEHFQELGIIHMNGRLYDPILRRFLNADENIQDPFNTQNYNKYGYVLNNPLMFNDPSGEFIFGAVFVASFIGKVVIGAIIGAAIGLATYTLSVGLAGEKFKLGGMFKSMMWGAISGAVTAGIGSAFTPAAGSYLTTLGKVVKAGVHAVAQGTLSMVQGGNFYQAFAAGALGSLAAGGWEKLAGNFGKSVEGMITFSALSGGAGSYLTGGNFWQGFVIGGTVAGLNDALHKNLSGPGDDKKITRQKLAKDLDVTKQVLESAEMIDAIDEYIATAYKSNPNAKILGKYGGKIAGNTATTLSVAVSGLQYTNGDISGLELVFDLGTTATTIWVSAEVGAAVGGPYGFAAGLAVGVVAEHVIKPLYNNVVKPHIVNPIIQKWNKYIVQPINREANKFKNQIINSISIYH